jgi:hypothetical protein
MLGLYFFQALPDVIAAAHWENLPEKLGTLFTVLALPACGNSQIVMFGTGLHEWPKISLAVGIPRRPDRFGFVLQVNFIPLFRATQVSILND